MKSSPRGGIVQLPPIDEPAPKNFVLQKYKTVASSIIKLGRVNELRKFNSLLPACILPASVLQRIFITCAQTSFRTTEWSWIVISFVCSTWRNVALDCSELWSYIDCSHSKWTALSLHRSKILPISLRAMVQPNNRQAVQNALHYAPMIREIHLVSSVCNITPLMAALQAPNRSLESLILEVSRPDDTSHDLRYSKRSVPPPGPRLPSMTYLELHRAPISLVSPRFTNLRHLSLHHLPFSERSSRHDFFTLLERFVMLEHLTLVHAFPKNVASGSCNLGRVVHLPNLITISLTGSVPELVNILDCVILQPAGQVHCHVDKMGDFKTNFWRLARSIGSHFHAVAHDAPLGILSIEGCEEHKRFTDKNSLNPDFRQTLRMRVFGGIEELKPLLDLMIGPDVNTVHDEVLISALTFVWDALPLANINTLTLRNLDIVTQKSWPRLLYSLPMLRVIEIVGHSPNGLLWALLMNARSHSHLEHDDMSSLLLPTLEDIYLHNVDCFAGGFMVSPINPVNLHCDLDDSRFLDVLSAYLEDRQRCNMPLRSLSISHCNNVLVIVLNDIRGRVSHTLWDRRGLHIVKSVDPVIENTTVYRSHWPSRAPPRRHYFRLRTLMELD